MGTKSKSKEQVTRKKPVPVGDVSKRDVSEADQLNGDDGAEVDQRRNDASPAAEERNDNDLAGSKKEQRGKAETEEQRDFEKESEADKEIEIMETSQDGE